MGYLATEIIALIAGAAVLGFIIGWAAFGLGKKKVVAVAAPVGLQAANPKLEADVKAAVDARKKAEGRVLELEQKESTFNDRLQERDAKVAELSHQLDELAKIRVEAAAERSQSEQRDQRITALESQLRQRDADMAKLAAQSGNDAVALDLQQQVIDRERQVTKLKAELETIHAQVDPSGPKVADLQAEIAELRATLVATAGAAPTTASEKDAIIGRLNEEVTGLRAAYEAAEQALEEQDAAIDKLTRELVTQQQRVATLEGREGPRPSSGVMPRPTTTNPQAATAAVAGVPKPQVAAQGTQVFKSSPIADLPRAEPKVEPPKVELPKPAPVVVAPVVAAPVVVAPVAPKMELEANESTVAVSLADIVSRIDTKVDMPAVSIPLPQPPAPQPPAPQPVVVPAKVDKIEISESTVAVSLADIIGQIDQKKLEPKAPPPMVPEILEISESTVAMMVPVDLLDDDAPRTNDGDDLKRIKGIGPATEKRLNGAGITRWSQVADLSDNDLPAIADLLKVSVDKIKPWVEQAKALRS